MDDNPRPATIRQAVDHYRRLAGGGRAPIGEKAFRRAGREGEFPVREGPGGVWLVDLRDTDRWFESLPLVPTAAGRPPRRRAWTSAKPS